MKDVKERCIDIYEQEKRKSKEIYKSECNSKEQTERKNVHDLSGSRKLFWKDVRKVKCRKIENCIKIKNRIKRPVVGENDIQENWKNYFENHYTVDTEEQFIDNIFSSVGARMINYFWESH